MSSFQRRRGHWAKIWPIKLVENARNDNQLEADLNAEPYLRRVVMIPLRGSKAEVPGQQQIELYTMIVADDMPGFGLQSRVEVFGKQWDVAAPPVLRTGTRHTRHLSADLRKRPNRG